MKLQNYNLYDTNTHISFNREEYRIFMELAINRYGNNNFKVLKEFHRIAVLIDYEIRKKTFNFTNEELFYLINNNFKNFVKMFV